MVMEKLEFTLRTGTSSGPTFGTVSAQKGSGQVYVSLSTQSYPTNLAGELIDCLVKARAFAADDSKKEDRD